MTYRGKLKNNNLVKILNGAQYTFVWCNNYSEDAIYALCYIIEHDTYLAWNIPKKITEIYKVLSKQINARDFAIFDIRMIYGEGTELFSGRVYEKTYHFIQPRCSKRFPKNTTFINGEINPGDIAILILFKNEEDKLLTQLSNCFNTMSQED